MAAKESPSEMIMDFSLSLLALNSTYEPLKLTRNSHILLHPKKKFCIEAFHSIVQREVIDRFKFDSFYHAKHTLAAHRSWYDKRFRKDYFDELLEQPWN